MLIKQNKEKGNEYRLKVNYAHLNKDIKIWLALLILCGISENKRELRDASIKSLSGNYKADNRHQLNDAL